MTQPDPTLKSAVADEIIAKRDRLLEERAALSAQREDLLARQRRNDRELSDCRATARFFGIDVEFPSDPARDEAEHYYRRAMEAESLARRRNTAVHGRPVETIYTVTSDAGPTKPTPEPAPSPAVLSAPVEEAKPRPPVREFIVKQLAMAGKAGAKAAALREAYERKYGTTLHEKTIGMTLYRLLQDDKVARDGHVWFLIPQTEAPGAGTPGARRS